MNRHPMKESYKQSISDQNKVNENNNFTYSFLEIAPKGTKCKNYNVFI